jgi:hypothetical protein
MSIVGHVYASHPATRFMLDELVSCDWNNTGHVTVHRIVAIQRCVQSQTGTMFLVEPPVHKPDRGNPHRDPRGDWIDCAWFTKDGLEVL